MNRKSTMNTFLTNSIGKTTKAFLVELYPVAGFVGIATYILVECFLE